MTSHQTSLENIPIGSSQKEKHGKPLSSYLRHVSGLKTHLENNCSKSKHLLVFNKDPTWYLGLFSSTKKTEKQRGD